MIIGFATMVREAIIGWLVPPPAEGDGEPIVIGRIMALRAGAGVLEGAGVPDAGALAAMRKAGVRVMVRTAGLMILGGS
jgi:hypothetical protein